MADARSPRLTQKPFMLFVTRQERVTLTVLGGLALVALGILVWQGRHPPIRVESGPLPPYAQWDARLTAARQLDLNTATVEELERLPEVGPTLAQRIVEYRAAHGPFRLAEEIVQVPGIGPKTYEALQEYITVRSR